MKIVILGAGGHGEVVADMIAAGARVADAALELVGFLDDDPRLAGREVGGTPVLGNLADVGRASADAFVVAIGNNHARARIADALVAAGRRVVSIQHPRAIVSRRATIGDGTMVSAGAVVITRSRVGRGVILNTGCTVDHHTHIEDYAHIAPGVHLGGEVSIGPCTLVGIGATVLPRCRIGAGCTIGAGAVVIADVPDGATAVGVPASLLPSTVPGQRHNRPLLVNR
jgi:sugar O-acyltransferase (sialic acid O-acetyltransferase NeuD family)